MTRDFTTESASKSVVEMARENVRKMGWGSYVLSSMRGLYYITIGRFTRQNDLINHYNINSNGDQRFQ